MDRALSIMKVRGSQHSKDIRSFSITNDGLNIERRVKAQTGVLTGSPIPYEPRKSLQYIPAKARFVVETLRETGEVGMDELSKQTGLAIADLTEELEILTQQGLVVPFQVNYQTRYRMLL